MGLFDKKPQAIIQEQINQRLGFINQKYIEIGRYVKIHLSDKIEDEQVQNLLKSINQTLEELTNLNEQLNALNGIKICKNCGATIPVNSAFCANCGTRQPMPNNPQQNPNMNMYNQPVNYGYNNVPPVQPQPQYAQYNPYQNNQPMPNQQFANNGQSAPTPQANNSQANTQQNAVINNPQNKDTTAFAPEAEKPQETADTNSTDETTAANQTNQINETQENTPPQEQSQPTAENTENTENTQNTQTETTTEQPQENTSENPVENFIYCSNCGSKEPADMMFCSQCGNKLN